MNSALKYPLSIRKWIKNVSPCIPDHKRETAKTLHETSLSNSLMGQQGLSWNLQVLKSGKRYH